MKPKVSPGFQMLCNSIIITLFFCFFSSCLSQPAAGISKDLNTGMVTTYHGLLMEKAQLLMDGEEISHSNIPLGKSFVIVNQAVKGLTAKDGKLAVGCALTITAEDGRVLLSEPDLFKDNDGFENIDYLRCTVNTGKPMQPEEKYDVHVVFTDKNGTGKIENKLSIRVVNQ